MDTRFLSLPYSFWRNIKMKNEKPLHALYLFLQLLCNVWSLTYLIYCKNKQWRKSLNSCEFWNCRWIKLSTTEAHTVTFLHIAFTESKNWLRFNERHNWCQNSIKREGTDWLNHSMYSAQLFSNTKHIEAWSSLKAIAWMVNRFCALCLEKHVRSVLHSSMMHFLCKSTSEIITYLPDC